MKNITRMKELYFSHLEYKPKGMFHLMFESIILYFLKNIPTLIGIFIRNVTYKLILKRLGFPTIINKGVEIKASHNMIIGKEVTIKSRSYLNANSGLIIGDNTQIAHNAHITADSDKIIIGSKCYIGPYTIILGMGQIKIEDNVLVAGQCFIVSGDHDIKGIGPVNKNKHTKESILIKEGSWIASNVKILGGVTIGKCAVIGAGAVVTKDIPDYAVAVGVPAKVIKIRK